MEYSKNAIIRKNNKYTILGNVKNGKWIRISNTLYNSFEELWKQGGIEGVNSHSKPSKLGKILTDMNVLVEKEEVEEVEKVKAITIAITNRCNLKCLHCGYSANPTDNNELDKDEILFAISQIKNIEHLIITGGEPLLHKDFYEIAKYIGKNVSGQKILMTNATLINKDNVALIIENFDGIGISLDAASERVCDEIRGSGVFEKVISVIKLLKSKNYNKISLSFVKTEINKNEVDEFKKLCKDLEVEAIIRSFFTMGRGHENKSSLKLKNKNKKRIDTEIAPISEYRKNLTLATRCGAAVNSLYIQFNGDIFPCPVAGIDEKFKMGNMKEVSDLNSYITKRYEQVGFDNYSRLSYDKLGQCSECEVRDFCWRCLQEYYEIFTDGTLHSKECCLRKQDLMDVVWGD